MYLKNCAFDVEYYGLLPWWVFKSLLALVLLVNSAGLLTLFSKLGYSVHLGMVDGNSMVKNLPAIQGPQETWV